MQTLLTVAGHQVLAWAVGIAATTALLDLGPGFRRDHPPPGRRWAGMAVGPLVLTGFVLLIIATSCCLELVLVCTPFALTATLYSWSWLRHHRADQRRLNGWQAAVLGAASLLGLLLLFGPDRWAGGIVIGAYAGSAALLGGLSTILLTMVTARKDRLPGERPATPYGLPARVTATGLGLVLLAGFEMVGGLSGGAGLVEPFLLWMALSLLLPLLLVAAGHKWFPTAPRLQPFIWGAAVLSALVGQAVIHATLMLSPVTVVASGL